MLDIDIDIGVEPPSAFVLSAVNHLQAVVLIKLGFVCKRFVQAYAIAFALLLAV